MATLLLLITGIVGGAGPANGFELFGFTFFESEEDPADDVIDPVAYDVSLELVPEDADLRATLESRSLLFRQSTTPPSGTVGLVSRAQDDYARLVSTLYGAGRYGGIVHIAIDGRPLESIALTETLASDGTPVPVDIRIEPGPLFTFGSIAVSGPEGPVDYVAIAERAGLVPGEPARSTIVLETERALVVAWGEVGHPFAEIADRRLVADHDTTTVDVAIRVTPGPEAVFGEVTVEGAQEIDARFIARHADIPQGTLYDTRLLARAQRNLRRLEALGSVVISTADHVNHDGSLPITITVTERKPRVVNFGASVSSTEGASVEASWRHRNLFGQSETLRLEGAVGRLFEADTISEHDARALIDFHKPGIFNARTDLNVATGFIQEDPDPYHRESVFAQISVAERKTDHLTLSAGAEVEASWVDDAFGSEDYILVGIPLIAEYDTRDNPLDATQGFYVRALGEPFAHEHAIYGQGDVEVRHYRSIDEDGLIVLALRGRVGSIAGASLTDIPAHRRFYAGGAGSVRGYDLYDVGPRVPGVGATGGRARVETSAELRWRITQTVGVVPFFDAGMVTVDPFFGGRDQFQASVGLGLRYYTPVGPVRFDVAVPIDPRPDDPDVAFYFGIGQAF